MSRPHRPPRTLALSSSPSVMFKPRDQPGWHNASEWLLPVTIAVHGFGNDFYSAHKKVTEKEVEEVFRLYGKILHTQIWRSQRGGAWAFVTFTCKEDRDAAICQLDGQTIDVWTREGHRQIQWQTPLKVTAPRFHAVRFYYDQFAAARIVPAELSFTPSARPGRGGTFQPPLGRSRRPFLLPPKGPRHGRRQPHNLFVDTSYHNSYERPSSPALSRAETSIQWGQERVMTPDPVSPAYDSEQTFCSSGGNVSPGEDDGEEMEEYDYDYEEHEESQAMSPFNHRSTIPRNSPPSSQYDDHDDSSVYPQSPRSTSEPSSQGRKRRRGDDEFEDEDDANAMLRRLQQENERLRRERDEAREEADGLREAKETQARELEEACAEYRGRIDRLTDNLCTSLERGQGRRPLKRNMLTPPPPEPPFLEVPNGLATLPITASLANNIVSALQSADGATLLTMLRQMANGNRGQA